MPSRSKRHKRVSKDPPTTTNEPHTNAGTGNPSTKPGKKPPLTHFLCIPLINDTSRPILAASLRRFREEADSVVRAVAEEAKAEGAAAGEWADSDQLQEILERDERAVRPVGTLHLTLGVMSLAEAQPVATDAGDRAEAGRTLADAKALLENLDLGSLVGGSKLSAQAPDKVGSSVAPTASLSADTPLRITLKGLRSMHTPAKTSFLYTSPNDSTDRLQPFCQALKHAFVEAGLMLDEKKKGRLKLHATVLNTVYARPVKRKDKVSRASITASAVPEASDPRQTLQKDPDDESAEQIGEETASLEQRGEHEGLQQGQSQYAADSSIESGTSQQPQRPSAKNKERRNRGPLRFDARSLLEHFENYEWINDLQLDRIAICKMGAAKIKDELGAVVDEAYEEVAVRRFVW